MRCAICALVPSLIVAACGDSDTKNQDAVLEVAFPDAGDTSEVTSSVSFVTLCDGFARACCNVERCVEPGQPDDDCMVATRGYCEDVIQGPLSTHITPGTVQFSESAASECFGYYLAGQCGDSFQFEDPPAACDGMFQGSGTAGAPCAFDAICAPAYFCKPDGDACPGTCAARGDLGASCNAVDALCRADLVCTDDEGGTCVAPVVASGAACALTSQCPAAEFCSPSEARCVADLGAGDPCPGGTGCGAGHTCDFAEDPPICRKLPLEGETCDRFCAFPLLCDQASMKCIVGPQEPGDACVDATARCGYSNLECNAATGLCEVRGGVGTACGGPDGDLNCTSSYCDGDFLAAGTCRAFKRLGDTCEGFGECGNRLTCRDGTCQERAHPCRGPGSLACF